MELQSTFSQAVSKQLTPHAAPPPPEAPRSSGPVHKGLVVRQLVRGVALQRGRTCCVPRVPGLHGAFELATPVCDAAGRLYTAR